MPERSHYELHDLPNTKERNYCWLEISERQLINGRINRAVTYRSSAKSSGCDLPDEIGD